MQKSTVPTSTTISEEPAAIFERQEVVKSVTYEPPKKLTEEQINALNEQQAQATLDLIKDVVGQNVTNQAAQTTISYNGLEISTESANLMTDIFGSMEDALPPVPTTPEDAQAAISEGGAYSVEAVSQRIMHMANALSEGDTEKLAQMQEAVKQGFEEAGLDLETGEGMPDITMDTFNYVMGEFDKLLAPEAAVAQ